jgi:hypothetical protein
MNNLGRLHSSSALEAHIINHPCGSGGCGTTETIKMTEKENESVTFVRHFAGETNINREDLSREEWVFYKQSLYIANIERFFGRRGLVCYAHAEHEGGNDFAFRHLTTGERYLVFSRLDDVVFSIAAKVEASDRIIIDVTDEDLAFTNCEYCSADCYLDDDLFVEAKEAGCFLLYGDKLFECENNRSPYFSCQNCWGPMRPKLLEEIQGSLDAAEFRSRENGGTGKKARVTGGGKS